MNPTIPSFYNVMASDVPVERPINHNPTMRTGEIRRVIFPEDIDSRSKKQIEYDVYVQHVSNGTAVGKMYHNCLQANGLAGLADSSRHVLRKSTGKPGEDTTGSKVLILCVNGDPGSAIIIGGIKDTADTADKGLAPKDRTADFADLNWTYNGINFRIRDDGSMTLTYNGATTSKGKRRSSTSKDEVGTEVKISRNGNFKVSTSKQSFEINHEKGTIKITGDSDLILQGSKIHIGEKASEKAVLGDTLVKILKEILKQISVMTHAAPGGATSPPLNAAAFVALSQLLETALSSFVTVSKLP